MHELLLKAVLSYCVAGDRGFGSEPLLWPRGSSVSIQVARGSTALLLSHGRGIGPRCERDTGVWDPGLLGIQVVRRTQLNGPKRVANTAQGWHPLQKGLVPRSFGEAGWRGLPGPACSGNTQPAGPAKEKVHNEEDT